MEWYYAKHGKQEGPIDLATIQGMVQAGQVGPTDLVWREGMAEWTPAQQVAELHPQPPQPSYAAPPAASSAAPPVSPGPGPGMQAPMGGVPQPGYQQPHAPVPQQNIPNYLVPAILVTVFCLCWPFGIPAIVYAAKVDGLVARGDLAGAIEASNKAKMWTWVTFGSGLAIVILYVLLAVLVSAGSM